MRKVACRLAGCLLLCWDGITCNAQQPVGATTLGKSLTADEAQQPPLNPVADHNHSAAPRPAGTMVRPEDGVQHPDLDQAWEDYESTLSSAVRSIQAAISKQFDLVTAKGDLDAAEKWLAIGETFNRTGQLPADTETSAAVSGAIAQLRKAADRLARAYEDVVKTLTTEGRVADAKAVRQESADVRAVAGQRDAVAGVNILGGEGKRERPMLVRKRKWTLVLWNTHNAHWRDRGTKSCNITASFRDQTVFEQEGLEVPWFRDRDAHVAVEIISPGIDAICVSITAWHGPGSGGLAEIQLFDDRGSNIAPTFEIEASAPGEAGDPRVLLDGDTAAGGPSRWCLPNRTLGWLEMRRPGLDADRRLATKRGLDLDKDVIEATKLVGDHDGLPFEVALPSMAELAVIRVHSGGGVDSVQAVYRKADGSLEAHEQHGGNGGRPSDFVLRPGESILGISGQVRDHVALMQFHTNLRVSPKYGEEHPQGKPFVLVVPKGKQFVGFIGRAGTMLEAVGLRYRTRR